VQQLDEGGFERSDFVGSPGEYSLRGGILDIFSYGNEYPIRCEFFGDTIESIREFDPLSQRSVREIAVASIVPDLFKERGPGGGEPQPASLLQYLQTNALVVLIEPELVWKGVEETCTRDAQRTIKAGILREQMSRFLQVHHESFSQSLGSIDFHSLPQPSFNGNIRLLREHLLQFQNQGVRVLIACDGHAELDRIRELVMQPPSLVDGEPTSEPAAPDSRSPNLENVEFVHHSVHAGFLLPSQQLACYTEHQIFGRQKRRGAQRRPRFRGVSLKELQQLQKGDYVVHQDFGIGRFDGLKKIRVSDVEQEVMKLLYEEKDTLYVNLNYLGKVQKYSSKDGHIPKLTRLGTQEWERLKARAKKRIQDIARDLIRLYAKRKGAAGHAFQPDSPWQKELEASFVYEDTFDQAKATLDVKQDMEQPFPMDRLVCGDVGFGKTEVAVRAAFKAVLDGKQVAVLVPTTILAIQHFNTFLDRTSRYAVRIAVISRLKSKREQSEMLEQLASGAIDIIIGTHRILSKDVRFKTLGLLIVDEEHRFGVAAKEKLRQISASVDTLTLTATPIPRTLHFSLMGARDLSIIATPPRNRLPIVVEIAQYDETLIKEAARREVSRGGQVYFVHDRISDIDVWTERLRGLLPAMRIHSAHGQMHAHELEKVMLEFQEKKIDVLVCTKIIESGLDIPNVNTIIVNRADRFGMSELYQLKGRVGRSNIQAYAYLLVPPISVLPRTTIQRLQAVEEFTELGSGFNLAMRDLEIRGAGNLLGAEQSGFIESMGFETYTRILDDAVTELKEQEFRGLFPEERERKRAAVETVVEVELNALIPSTYVENDAERLEIYRRMYAITTHEQLAELGKELRDRFGQHPDEVGNLFNAVRLRLAASAIGFTKVLMGRAGIEMEFPPETDTGFYEAPEYQTFMTEISRRKGKNVALKQSGKQLRLTMKSADGIHPIEEAIRFLQGLAGSIGKA
jgi:transcription-repair coupling factor (superfamily II helicase)